MYFPQGFFLTLFCSFHPSNGIEYLTVCNVTVQVSKWRHVQGHVSLSYNNFVFWQWQRVFISLSEVKTMIFPNTFKCIQISIGRFFMYLNLKSLRPTHNFPVPAIYFVTFRRLPPREKNRLLQFALEEPLLSISLLFSLTLEVGKRIFATAAVLCNSITWNIIILLENPGGWWSAVRGTGNNCANLAPAADEYVTRHRVTVLRLFARAT